MLLLVMETVRELQDAAGHALVADRTPVAEPVTLTHVMYGSLMCFGYCPCAGLPRPLLLQRQRPLPP